MPTLGNQEAEFDAYADKYHQLHAKSVGLSGEKPEYFAEHKVGVLGPILDGMTAPILDYGCGIGNLTVLLARSYPNVVGFDVSKKSVAVARERVPNASFEEEDSALKDGTFGAVILANVLHHVVPSERPALVRRLGRALAPGGKFVIFEHNPINPLTRKAVRDCPFDEGVVLLRPNEGPALLTQAGLTRVRRDFVLFFPRPLAFLRAAEPLLRRVPLGAQVCVVGTKGVH